MRSKMVAKSEVVKREEQLEALSSQLQRVEQQLSWTTTDLNKERARGDSLLQHKESLQAKQQNLTQQLDSLDQECEQLKTSLADGEDEQQMMRERLKEIQEEKWEVQGQLEAQKKVTEKLKQEKLSLEHSASELQRTISELGELNHEMKEKEKLLVFFPDLHLPVETQFEATGNIMEDMGKQLQANNIRISILEEENSRLRSAISKMKEAQQEAQKFALPTQLWIQFAEKPGPQGGAMGPPTGYPGGTSFQGQASRPPTNSSPVGSAARNRPRNSPTARRDSPAFHRTSSNQLPLGEGVREAAVKFSYKEAAVNSYSRGKGRGRNLPPPGHCTRNHQK
ncbi:coiled-coil domain-containing protein 157-like [Candoia aspera]|uniref:coiled-coil domain-containing protein 157-like n=1 Tax=Candoia aspera TaxID=51853 RepID=UPI002FD7EAD1